MSGATPFANNCYCATAAASATKATSFIPSCASSLCAGGDVSDDMAAMKSIYASYCGCWFHPAGHDGLVYPGSDNHYD